MCCTKTVKFRYNIKNIILILYLKEVIFLYLRVYKNEEDDNEGIRYLCRQKNGNTEIMMKEAFMAIEEKCGAECQLVRVQESSIHTCTGCEACMTNHLKGNWEFRCIHKNGTDHFYFIEQLMREADAILYPVLLTICFQLGS